MENIDTYINSFATRCFINVADHDYINARLCYRAALISQFHWAALQAFEKYYKGILLYNRIKAKKIRHDLAAAQKKAEELPFEIRLSESSQNFIKHLDQFGRFRYLDVPYFIYGPKLLELDRAVWELRRYCRVLDYTIEMKNQEKKSMLELELDRNIKAEDCAPQNFRISGGVLEKILDKKNHPARAALVWQNGFFGKSNRKTVSIPTHSYAENPPLSLKPDLLDHVLEYVYMPKEVIDAYRT